MSTKMIMQTETSEFMMSYIIITEKNNAVIVDGGRPEDIPLLKEAVGGRHIAAWFLTHPHIDHISAFNDIVARDDKDFDFDKVYCHFPPSEHINAHQLGADEPATIGDWEAIRPKLGDKVVEPQVGDKIRIDELEFEILYRWEKDFGFIRNVVNDSSLVFRMTTPNTTVLFMGDLGPEGGDKLLETQKGNLHAEYVQMAHHGHMCCGPDVYMDIDPRVCLWNAPDWLWAEPDCHINYRMWGQGMTRKWMERIGVTEHYITMNGTQTFEL